MAVGWSDLIFLLLLNFTPFFASLFGRRLLAFVSLVCCIGAVLLDVRLIYTNGRAPLLLGAIVAVWFAAWFVAVYSIMARRRFSSKTAIRLLYRNHHHPLRGKNRAVFLGEAS
jgi:hypothetical protein